MAVQIVLASHFIPISTQSSPDQTSPGLYHPTQLSIHYVFCGAKSYFVGSLDWLAWQDRRKQPCLAQREEERSVGVVEGDDCFACLLVILSDSQAESNCKLD